MFSVFFSTMALEMSGYFTQNVPPKPQQTSGSCISTSLTPSIEESSRARLRLDAELAQARAGIVIGDGVVKPGRNAGRAAHVDQEADQLVHLGGKGNGARLPLRIALEQAGIVLLQHAGAGARGRDDIVVVLEGADGVLGDGASVGAVAGIVGRLAAAGLRHRHIDACSRCPRCSLIAAKPTVGRNRSTRQVTNRPTRGKGPVTIGFPRLAGWHLKSHDYSAASLAALFRNSPALRSLAEPAAATRAASRRSARPPPSRARRNRCGRTDAARAASGSPAATASWIARCCASSSSRAPGSANTISRLWNTSSDSSR